MPIPSKLPVFFIKNKIIKYLSTKNTLNRKRKCRIICSKSHLRLWHTWQRERDLSQAWTQLRNVHYNGQKIKCQATSSRLIVRESWMCTLTIVILLLISVCLSQLANCRSQLLLDCLERYVKLFISADGPSSHELVSQFSLAILLYAKNT